MAAIPRYGARTSTPQGGVSGGLARPAMGPAIGEGISAIGQGFSRRADETKQLQAEEARRRAAEERAREEAEKVRLAEEKERDEAWFVGVGSKATLDIVANVESLRGQTPPDGSGYADGVLKTINDTYAPYEAAATTPHAKELVAKAKASALTQFGAEGIKRQTEMRSAWTGAQSEIGLSQSVAAVGAASTPDMVDAVVEQQLGALTDVIKNSAASPEDRTKRSLTAAQTLADAALERKAVLQATATGTFSIDGAPADLYAAIENQESRGNPNAVSPKGALGVMQLMPDTARQVAKDLGLKDVAGMSDGDLKKRLLADPNLNRTLGRTYFDQQMARYDGNTVLALAAYNAGPGAVDKWLTTIGDPRKGQITSQQFAAAIPYAETKDYVASITRKVGGVAANLATPQGRARAQKAGEAVIKEQNEALINDLDIRVSRGEAGQAEIEALVKKGRLSKSSADYARLTKAADTEAEKREEAAQQATRVAMAWSHGVPLDPTDKDDKDALDADYLRRAATWAPADSARQTVAYVARMGMLPESVKGRMAGGLRSADPAVRLQSAQLYGQIKAQPNGSAVLSTLPATDAETAELLLSYARVGRTPQEAVADLEFNSKLGAEERKARDQAFATSLGPKKAAATNFMLRAVERDRGVQQDRGFFGGSFPIPPQMQTEFIAAAEGAYRRTGDRDAALEAGYQTVRRVWGPSAINGRSFMKNAPELLFGVPTLSAAENADWMRGQLAAEIKDDAPTAAADPKTLRLAEAPLLAKGGRPVYWVAREVDGEWKPVLTKAGRPLYWQPNWNTSPKKRGDDAKLKKEREAELARSRERRPQALRDRAIGDQLDAEGLGIVGIATASGGA